MKLEYFGEIRETELEFVVTSEFLIHTRVIATTRYTRYFGSLRQRETACTKAQVVKFMQIMQSDHLFCTWTHLWSLVWIKLQKLNSNEMKPHFETIYRQAFSPRAVKF